MISMIRDKKAEGYVDSGVKILIAIVIGSLLLGSVYALTKDSVLPTLNDKVEALFDYSGSEIKAEERILGDINNDGVVDQADRQILASELANGLSGKYEQEALDIDGNGTVDIADLTLLCRM